MNLSRRVDLLEAQSSSGHGAQAADETIALEAKGWRAVLAALGPTTFTGEFAPFHARFWDWYYPLLRAQQSGVALSTVSEYLAYLLLLGRGMGKSSTVEWAVILAGALVEEAVVLYVSSTTALAVSHLNSIRKRIESARVALHYPRLSEPQVGKFGNRYGWRSDMLATRSGLTVFAVGLEQEVRGLRDGDMRPTLIVFDDVDGKSDSPDVVRKKEAIIGGSILPTGTPTTVVLFAQNLIHQNSVATRIAKRYSELLSHREESTVIKAYADDVKLDKEGTRWLIKAGTPTWAFFDRAACQKFLDDSGPTQWYAEYQHDFEQNKSGLVLQNYNDAVSVITWDEFARVFGESYIPSSWNKYVFHDWARTKTQYHANVAGMIAVSSQNTPLPGCIFLYEMLSFEAGTEADDVGLKILETISPDFDAGGGVRRTWRDLIRSTLTRTNLEAYVSDATKLIDARRSALARVIPAHVKPILKHGHFKSWQMSHEQANSAMQVYKNVFGLPFQPSNPGRDGGIDLINYYMRVDPDLPHPFRPNELGYTRFFVVVKNHEKQYPIDISPEALHGSNLARYQFTHWRHRAPRLSEAGEVETGPEKSNDDWGNGLMMLFHRGAPSAAPLTRDEQVTAVTPECSRYETLKAASPHEHGLTAGQELQFFLARQEAKKKIKPRYLCFDDDFT